MKIIILHGLYVPGLLMRPLSYRLQQKGYETETLDYSTIGFEQDTVFDLLDRALSPLGSNVLVGHSLGGVVIKRYLEARKFEPGMVSHVVALGSPINGASIADKLATMGLGWIMGKAYQFGLRRHQDSWTHPQKLGCIAGSLPLGVRSALVKDMAWSDGTVTIEETMIDGMTDHVICKQSHTSMIYSSIVSDQIDAFIQNDAFDQTRAIGILERQDV